MNLIKFISNNSNFIEVIIAFLNLILIGLLTYKGYSLQKKTQAIELYSKLQKETFLCLSTISSFIAYFDSKANTTSYYLRTLFDHNTGDPDHEWLAKRSLKELKEVLEQLRTISLLLENYRDELLLSKYNNDLMQLNLAKVTHLQAFVLSESPSDIYESCMNSPESHWLEEEINFENSISEAKKKVNKILNRVKLLS
ncbi:hypothetical protein [Acinetobacter calcoaceticus]|uniref:hypothetical protein n=1 Tax=Acinetobacter calcoaceticus TaxID=471 RepID=UPI003A872A3B